MCCRFVSEQFPELEVSDELQKKLLIHPQSLCVTRIRELFPSVVSSKVFGSTHNSRMHTVSHCVACKGRKGSQVQKVSPEKESSSPQLSVFSCNF